MVDVVLVVVDVVGSSVLVVGVGVVTRLSRACSCFACCLLLVRLLGISMDTNPGNK